MMITRVQRPNPVSPPTCCIRLDAVVEEGASAFISYGTIPTPPGCRHGLAGGGFLCSHLIFHSSRENRIVTCQLLDAKCLVVVVVVVEGFTSNLRARGGTPIT